MSGRRFSRRGFLAAAALAIWARPRPATAVAGEAPADLPRVGAWARQALAAMGARGGSFTRHGAGVRRDLGPAGRLHVEPAGDGAVRVTLRRADGELEILSSPAAPERVGRVRARLARAAQGCAFDTLRRVPGGFELTFSSCLALRHAAPRRVTGEPPAVYGRLAAAALSGARRLLA